MPIDLPYGPATDLTKSPEYAIIPPQTEPWCSGLAYLPVKQKIAGSNPVGSAQTTQRGNGMVLWFTEQRFHSLAAICGARDPLYSTHEVGRSGAKRNV